MTFDNITKLLERRYGSNAQQLDDNHWVLEVMTERNRSQVVHVLLKQYSSNGRDVSRLIVDSPIGPVPQRYDFESLLRRNASLKSGAICIEDFRDEDNDLISYLTLRASHLVHTADEEEVAEMIETTTRVADDLEQEIFARDLR